MLLQLPLPTLLAVLAPRDWRALFDAALVPSPQEAPLPAAAGGAGGTASPSQQPAGSSKKVRSAHDVSCVLAQNRCLFVCCSSRQGVGRLRLCCL